MPTERVLPVAPGDETALTGQPRALEGEPAPECAGLDFVDRRGLVAPAGHAERHAGAAVLRTKLSTPELPELPDRPGVRVERAA